MKDCFEIMYPGMVEAISVYTMPAFTWRLRISKKETLSEQPTSGSSFESGRPEYEKGKIIFTFSIFTDNLILRVSFPFL
jgi:hypothetical protein